MAVSGAVETNPAGGADSRLSLERYPLLANALKLVSGRAAASALALLAAPVIARLFSPEHFGIAAFFVAIVSIAGPVSTLCLDQGIVLPKSDEMAGRLMSVALLSSMVTSVILLLALAGMAWLTGAVPFEDRLGAWTWLVPLVVLLIGAIRVGENARIRRKSFSNIARADVWQALGTPLTRIGGGLIYGSSVTALVFGYLVGLLLKLITLGDRRLFRSFSWREVTGSFRVVAEYRDLATFTAPAQLIRLFSNNLPVLLLAYLFEPAAVGFFAMGQRIVGAPAEAVVGSVRKVYVQRAAELRAAGKQLTGLLLRSTMILLAAGVVPLLLILFLGEDVTAWLLGEDWRPAGRLVEILAPWFFMIWLTMPSSALLLVLRKQRLWMGLQSLLALARLGAFAAAAALSFDLEQTVGAFVIASISVNLLVIVLSAKSCIRSPLVESDSS